MEMLAKIKVLGGYFEEEESKSKKGSFMAMIGLQTLVQISEEKSSVVLKSAMIKSLHHHLPPSSTSNTESCYLKSCFLCNKNLRLDKDIYMYRGDQGFCSVECRKRQIILDEMKEAEAKTSNIHKSYRYCSSASRRETRLLLEDLRRRNKPVTHHHQNHWAIVS